MAESKGIRRFLELVLDRERANRTQREAQDALNKATDPKSVNRNLSHIGKGFDSLRGFVLKLGAAIGAAFALRRIVDFGKAAVREFAAAEAVWSRLGQTLANVGVSMDDVKLQLDGVVAAMGRVSTMSDEDVASSLETLVQLSGDYGASLDRLQLVADLAAGASIDFAQASEMVGKAMAGNTMALTRLFPRLKGSKDILGDLAKIQDGMALKQRGTWAGATKILSDEWGNFKEAVGEALTTAGGGTSIIESLTGAVRGFTIWVGQHRMEIEAFAAGIGKIVDALKSLPRYWENLAAGRRMLENDPTLRLPAMQANPPGNRIAGLTVTVPPILPPTEAELKAAEDHVKALWAHLGKFIAETQNAGSIPMAGVLDRFAGLSEAGKQKVLEQAARMKDMIARGGTLGTVTPLGEQGSGMVDVEALQREVEMMENLGNVAGMVADSITDSFRHAFDLMREDAVTTGNFLEAVFRGFGAAALQGLAQYAGGKVKENIALAIEEGARALGFTALGNFASTGAAASSAAGHLAAAAAWGVLAGGAGSAGNALTGRGGGHGMTNNRDAGAGIASRAERAGAEVHVYINPWDANNPGMQRSVAEASQRATERFGTNTKVTVKPYPGMPTR